MASNYSSDTEPSPGNSEKRLLIVDDEAPVRELLQTYFAGRGYSILTAATGEEALRIAREHLVHLILLDFLLPDCDGLELIVRLQNIKSRRPVILMTGFGDDSGLLEKARNVGAADCISKTSPLDQLLKKVELALAASGKARRSAAQSTDSHLAGPATMQSSSAVVEPALAPDVSQFGISFAVELLSARHASLGNNAARAAALAAAAGPALGLNEGDSQALVHAAAWHDIALLGWDRKLIDTFLRAPGKLMPSDLAVVRRHPVESQQMLGFSALLKSAGEIIRAHHEHWDGTGYPDGLKHDAIPWLARLLAVIVAYCNRLFSTRSAFNEIRQSAGSLFDREAIEAVSKVAANFEMPIGAREIQLSDLAPGMILARDIVNHDGNLVLSKDQELTSAWINKVLNIHQVTPLPPTTQISC